MLLRRFAVLEHTSVIVALMLYFQVMGSAPPEFFLGWTSPGTQIWSRLRMAGLEVEKLYSLDRRRVLLKIRLPTNKLEEVQCTK